MALNSLLSAALRSLSSTVRAIDDTHSIVKKQYADGLDIESFFESLLDGSEICLDLKPLADIDECHDGAVDAVLGRAIGHHPYQEVPLAVRRHGAFDRLQGL